MDFQFQPGDTQKLTENMPPGMGSNGYGIGGEARVYPGRGAGGKLRTTRRGSSKKATPYDRPASGRHATSGGTLTPSTAAARSSSLASWLVGSASRLIASSASYFFPSLFRPVIPALPNISAHELTAEEDEQEEQEPPLMQVNARGVQENKEYAKEGWGLVAIGDDIEKEEPNLDKVEDMLKNKTWSRGQVDRITELLQARIMEVPVTVSHEEEAAGRTTELVRAVGTPIRRMEEAAMTPISEAQRWREELKRARTDCMPIEIARAYMGERTLSRSGLPLLFRNTAHHSDRVAELQPPPGIGLAGDRYRSLPVVRSWARSPVTQVRKRSSFLEEEWMSVGPVRRTRQKAFHSTNSNPYARDMPAGETAALPHTHASPPIQVSQTARKILDTLEMLTPSPRGKFLSEDGKSAIEASPMVLTPDILNIQGRRNTRITEVSEFSNLRDMVTGNGKIEFGSVAKISSNSGTLTAEPSKESNHEDKIEVPEFLSGGKSSSFAGASHMFPGFSTTTSLISSPAADSAMAPVAPFGLAPSSTALALVSGQTMPSLQASAFVQSESKPLFSFSLPTSTFANRNLFGAPSTPAFASRPATGALSAAFATSSTSAMSSVASTIVPPPQSEGRRIGTETQVRGEGPMEAPKGGSPAFPFGSAPFQSSFSSIPGSNTFPFGTRDRQSGKGQAPASEAQSVSQIFSTLLPASSMSTISSLPSFGIVSGSQSNPFSSFKPLFGASTSVTKPSTIPSLTIEPSSVPFTFSPPPAPVSCSTPTFSVGSSSGAAPASITNAVEVSSSTLKSNVLDSTTVSVSVDSNSGPVFSFTSPSGGPKLPTSGTLETSLPLPTFTFGGASTMSNRAWTNVGQKSTTPILGQMFGAAGEMGSSTSSGLSFGSTSQIGSSTSSGLLFGLGTVSGGSMFSGASFSPGQSFGSGAGSMALPTPLTFGGQAVDSSPALFGSGSGSASGAELASSSAQSGLEFSTGLTSGEGGVEKTGRRFVRAKRKK